MSDGQAEPWVLQRPREGVAAFIDKRAPAWGQAP
jgi:hypothetical protein